MVIAPDSPLRPDVLALLEEHLSEMYATSPAESVHALDPDALTAPNIVFVTSRDHDQRLLGCGALKLHPDGLAEIKSMRTASAARGRGVARTILDHLLDTARAHGCIRASLETGAEAYFAPAIRLYERVGFTPCGAFADYTDDPHSRYFTLELS